LRGEVPDEGEGEATELVLLEEFIEVHVEQFEDEAEMALVCKRVK